jgi:uncharacterized LabA/DUF88 family protein
MQEGIVCCDDAMIPAVHNHQRIGVFVDVQNMYYSARNLYKKKVDFKSLLLDVISKRKLIRAIAYVIKADVKDESQFYDALERMGFEVKAKDIQVFVDGSKKGDWDVGIAMDVMRLAPKLDVIVLVSGDGDFTDLLEHAKSLGCRVEVVAFGKSTSHRLIEASDFFMDIDSEKRYLLKK